MIKKIFIQVLLATIFSSGYSQVDEDSSVLANSEKWKVDQHRGLFGLSRPEFGPVVTLSITKLDSANTKQKVKDSTELEVQGSGIEHYKYVTIRKTKTFRLSLLAYNDTSNVTFSIASTSKEKKKSVLGTIISRKNDDDETAVLDYKRDVSGVITTRTDDAGSSFLVRNFTSGSRITESSPFPRASVSGGFLVSAGDTLSIADHSSFGADLVLQNSHGTLLGGVKFTEKPYGVWIRKDLDHSMQVTIASFFAFIFSIKDI